MANTERKMVTLPDSVMRHHKHAMSSKQCGSTHIKEIAAPLGAVWSVVRRFDCPQVYKSFVRNSRICVGDGKRVGSIREIQVASGLPATVSIERLEVLDDEQHVIRFSIIGGDHRLVNYRSTMSLHEDGGGRTVVVESYVVDVPPGNCKEETCIFVDTIIGCNLSSLAKKVIF